MHGGTSNAEGWLAPPRRLAAELKLSANTAECCCAYNMLKLARHLYRWNPDSALLRLLRALAAQSPDGDHPAEDRLHAVLPFADAGRVEDVQHGRPDVLVLHRVAAWRNSRSSTTASTGATREGLYVNLFIPSELDWAEKGFKLRQETKYPAVPEYVR